jgi:hypothetical protein
MWLASLPQQMRGEFLEGHITSNKIFAEAYGRLAKARPVDLALSVLISFPIAFRDL